MSITLTGLSIYPVKGLKAVDLEAAEVEPWGLAHDRRWMIVDPQGQFITQRQDPRLALLSVGLLPAGIRLSLPGKGAIDIALPPPDTEQIEVFVWRDRVIATPGGAHADSWLTEVLGWPCRLVYMSNPDRARPVDPDFGAADDRVSFADGFPILATAQASLGDLNARLDESVPMNRFRPNLVVSGGDAWAEDKWRRVRIGSVVFRAVKDCARCIVTTIDQVTSEKSPLNEPIRTLATFRRKAGGRIIFGQNLVPDGGGVLRIGDRVTPLD